MDEGFELPPIQELIDTGQAWQLEGHVGRQCMAAIEAGDAILGPKPIRDYYGNLVPAWWMVAEGTKGSPEYAGQERPEEPSDDEKIATCATVGVTWNG
jgi:hypothetical protein